MRVPLSWLKEFVDIHIPVEELAQRLTMAGLEVASIDYIGVEGAELAWDREKIVIGNILEVRQHPNADRLVLADVEYGAAEPHTVVTGAPNLFQYRGLGRLERPLRGVYAKEGAELYDGHAVEQVKIKLKGRPVRGVMSDAMLCSEKELGLSDEHEGILILPDDAPVGAPLGEYLGDVVLDIDLTPNLARALSIMGVAREVAALTGGHLRLPQIEVAADGPNIYHAVKVTVETPELCPRFTATLIEHVHVGPSPYWMQRRLAMVGMRPINNVVDVTNYVMIELGQPSHAFDADKVADQHLIVRLARPGERLTTLDGKERELTPDRLLVCDPDGPLGLAGVMGGAESEVSERTTRVLLEAAIWNPPTIRRAAQALKLHSEASRRFERGVDYEMPSWMQMRAQTLLQRIAGAEIAKGTIDIYSRPWKPTILTLPPQEVTRIVGITLSAEEIAGLLKPLGFSCQVVDKGGPQEAYVHVRVPSYRQDVTILADLCEEVARMYGYDRIPATLLSDELPEQHGSVTLELEEKTRDVLAGCGLDEAITYSLIDMASIARVDPAAADPAQHLRLANPNTPEREYLRRSLLPTLLEALSANLRERDRVLLFEVGRVYLPRAGEVLPEEPRRLAIAMAGRRAPLSWHTADHAVLDFFDLKGIVETLLKRLNIGEQAGFVPLTDDARFHPGRSAALVSRGGTAETRIGVLGELHPEARERLDISVQHVLAAELDLDALFGLVQPIQYQPISRYPATIQDLAVIVGVDVAAERVAEAIRTYAGSILESLTLFDLYEGEQIGVGKHSLAYRLVFRSPERTLSDADLSKTRIKIIKGLERDVAASIRG